MYYYICISLIKITYYDKVITKFWLNSCQITIISLNENSDFFYNFMKNV